MWTETLPAELPAVACPPRKTLLPFGGLDIQQKQRVAPDFRCPPNVDPIGGLEVEEFQKLMPASKTPRLRRVSPFWGTHRQSQLI